MMNTCRVLTIFLAFALASCGAVESTVRQASRAPTSPPTTTTPTTAPTPGYILSSGSGAYLQGATYRWRVRVGKVDQTTLLNGATYKYRTGKVRQLNDM